MRDIRMHGGSLNYEQPLTDDITLTTILGYQYGKRFVEGATGGPARVFDWDFNDRVRQKSLEARLAGDLGPRSEEHTSELQSLMRISYADFCLKKQNITHYSIICRPSSNIRHTI